MEKLTKETLIEKTEGQLTEEQIDEIVDVLHPKDDDTLPKEFPHAVINKQGLMKGEATIEVDPKTGMHNIVTTPIKESNVSYTNLFTGEDEEKLNEVNSKALSEATGLELTDDEAMQLFMLVNKFKAGEKVSIYNEMPKPLQDMVNNLAMSKNPKVISQISKDLLKYFIEQIDMDTAYVDLQESIKNELDFGGMVDIYADHLRDSMEKDLLVKADTLEDQGKVEEANNLRAISKIYTSTYTMIYLKAFIKDSNSKLIKELHKGLKKFNKHCMEFNYKYHDTKFKINDVSLLVPIIVRHIECTEEEAKLFTLLFIRFCRDYSVKNIYDHTYMYYTIKNILFLDHVTKESEFTEIVKNNIKEIIKMLGE